LLRDAGELSRDLLRQQNQSTTPVAVAVLGMLSDFADSSWQSVMPAAALIPPSPSVPSDAVRGRITPVELAAFPSDRSSKGSRPAC
jgi:hypothetical protein